MSWAKWMRQVDGEDANRFKALLPSLDAYRQDEASFSQVTSQVACLVGGRLNERYRKAGYEGLDYRAFLIEHYRFSDDVADRLHDETAHFLSIPIENGFEYPSTVDMAAPFLDILAPKSGRRTRGFYCTPPEVVKQLLVALGPLSPLPERPRLIDHSCGTGTLGLAAFEAYRYNWPDNPLERSKLLAQLMSGWCFVERDPILAAITSMQLLALLFDEPGLGGERLDCWPIVCRDAFSLQDKRSYTHTIGNPPYLGEKFARDEIAKALKKMPELRSAYQGKSDLVFLFLMLGLNSLRPGGRLAFLTPAYWPTADGAGVLRWSIEERARVEGLEPTVSDIISAPGISALVVSLVKHESAKDDGGSEVKEQGPWRFLESGIQAGWLDRMEKWGRTLGVDGPFAVHAGVQSGADRLLDRHRKRFPQIPTRGNGIFILSDKEKEDLAPHLTGQERELIVPISKSPACGPFLHSDNGQAWLIYLDGSVDLADLPGIARHLSPYRPLLERRRECVIGRMPWWRLHWPRQKRIFTGPALLAPQRAFYPRFALAEKGCFSSVDVYHLVPRSSSVLTMEGWLCFLHSSPVHLWLKLRGKRKKDLLELYATPLKKIPLPDSIPLDRARKLNRIGEKVLEGMRDLHDRLADQRPWHLTWRDISTDEAPSVKAIIRRMDEADSLVAMCYGFSEMDLKRIQNEMAQVR